MDISNMGKKLETMQDKVRVTQSNMDSKLHTDNSYSMLWLIGIIGSIFIKVTIVLLATVIFTVLIGYKILVILVPRRSMRKASRTRWRRTRRRWRRTHTNGRTSRKRPWWRTGMPTTRTCDGIHRHPMGAHLSSNTRWRFGIGWCTTVSVTITMVSRLPYTSFLQVEKRAKYGRWEPALTVDGNTTAGTVAGLTKGTVIK